MGRGTQLTEIEIGKIIALNDENRSISYIAEKINRSRKVVGNFLADPDNYGKSKRPGRPKSLSERDSRLIFRKLSSENLSISAVKRKMNLSTFKSTIFRATRASEQFKFRKVLSKPPLTDDQKRKRLDFAKKYIV